mmetsp:Transcript_98768/g.247563  ORF Transcript_98768/g.247563 Transcript_98768/m.247563 type:complete len:109 (-) Transcript_98768:221-547(-)
MVRESIEQGIELATACPPRRLQPHQRGGFHHIQPVPLGQHQWRSLLLQLAPRRRSQGFCCRPFDGSLKLKQHGIRDASVGPLACVTGLKTATLKWNRIRSTPCDSHQR